MHLWLGRECKLIHKCKSGGVTCVLSVWVWCRPCWVPVSWINQVYYLKLTWLWFTSHFFPLSWFTLCLLNKWRRLLNFCLPLPQTLEYYETRPWHLIVKYTFVRHYLDSALGISFSVLECFLQCWEWNMHAKQMLEHSTRKMSLSGPEVVNLCLDLIKSTLEEKTGLYFLKCQVACCGWILNRLALSTCHLPITAQDSPRWWCPRKSPAPPPQAHLHRRVYKNRPLGIVEIQSGICLRDTEPNPGFH